MASKGTRYNKEQILRILKEVEAGTSVAEVCRKYGVAEQMVYRWRSKYGGRDKSEAKLPTALENKSIRLKKLLADTIPCGGRLQYFRKPGLFKIR